jgi:hypothetical protein
VIDLATLDTTRAAAEGVELELAHPVTRAPLGVYIRIVGQDSARYRQRVIDQVNARRGRRDALDADTLTEDAVLLAARCTVGWRGLVIEGEEIAYAADAAAALYRRFPWIREQVIAGVEDRALFLPAS